MKADDAEITLEFRALVKPLSIGLKFFGLSILLLACGLANPDYRYDMARLGMAIALAAGFTAASVALPTRWLSFCSIVTIWALAEAFFILMERSVDRTFWAATIWIAISLVVAPIFSRAREYVIAAAGMWLILGRLHSIEAPGGDDPGWSAMLMTIVPVLGTLLNVIFRRAHRESRGLRKELENLAYKDALTGIHNRRKLLDDIDRLHARGALDRSFFLMIDVDEFKRINDDFGHATGDRVLRQVAAALRACAGNELLGRLGGEEFGVLVRAGTEAQAVHLARTMLDAVRRLDVEGRRVTVSVGIAGMAGKASTSQLMSDADKALYQAKRAGRNCAVVHRD